MLDKVLISDIMGYVLLMNIWSVGQGVKTPPFHGGNTGSNPVRTISHSAIAQLVVAHDCYHDVVGSSPTGGANTTPIWVFFCF